MPWDKFVYALTTAVGRTDENGAANYYLIHRSPIDLAENYTQAFLGLTLTCARCHNHPMEKWTQVDYYGFANLFARVSVKEDDSMAGKSDTATVFSTPDGDLLHPRLGVPMAPRPLDGKPMPAHARAGSPRLPGAVDDEPVERAVFPRRRESRLGELLRPRHRASGGRPALHEPGVERAAVRSGDGSSSSREGFDVKALIRHIMTSAAYQRAAATTADNAKDDRFYSHYLIRRLPAEVILDAFSQVTGVPQTFMGFPTGTRALQLPDTRVDSYFLSVFGRPERVTTSAAERMQDPTLPQALHAINGETLNGKLKADDGLVARLVREGRGDGEAIDELYLSALSRPPSSRRTGGAAGAPRVGRDGWQRGGRQASAAGGSGLGHPHLARVPVQPLTCWLWRRAFRPAIGGAGPKARHHTKASCITKCRADL